MDTKTIAREPYGLQVISAWRSLGIGIPDALAKDESLILPVWRHSERKDPLIVRVRRPHWMSYWTASVVDAEVIKAAQSSHAYECILEPAYAEGVSVDHASDEFEPVRVWVDGMDMRSLARGVWMLHQTCQRLLDFAEGVEIGRPLVIRPTFNADLMVQAVTGLTLGPKAVGR
jgi:hypothetical protein